MRDNAEVILMRRSTDLPQGAIPLSSLAARIENGEPLTGAERQFLVTLLAQLVAQSSPPPDDSRGHVENATASSDSVPEVDGASLLRSIGIWPMSEDQPVS